jgi:calpain family cysteine protease
VNMCDSPALIVGGAQAGDIEQGAVGTCYLLGSIGVLAGADGLVEEMFGEYDVGVGAYAVRFKKEGRWRFVVVDDMLPATYSKKRQAKV